MPKLTKWKPYDPTGLRVLAEDAERYLTYPCATFGADTVLRLLATIKELQHRIEGLK